MMWWEDDVEDIRRVAGVIVSLVLGWTVAVYLKTGARRRLDPLLLAILLENLAGQLLSLGRGGMVIGCGVSVWGWAGLRGLEVATLATLSLLSGYRAHVTRSALAYHLTCLVVLGACLGLAALLARPQPCLPEADPRYTLFSLVLHSGLCLMTAAGLLAHCCPRPPPQLTADTSDYASTTSSTHSRACLRPKQRDLPTVTSVAVLLVSLSAHHIPVLVSESGALLGIWSKSSLVPNWSILLEGLLLPLVLALSDRTYLDTSYTGPRHPPQGLYGKFRSLGPSTLEVARQEHVIRFPITNGSLLSSLDGRPHFSTRHFTGEAGLYSRRFWMGRGMSSLEQLSTAYRMEEEDEPVYASLSSTRSACSATTPANDDFEFFQRVIPTPTIQIPEEPNPMPISLDSLMAVLNNAQTSYLDTGDTCAHPEALGKKVFLSDYL